MPSDSQNSIKTAAVELLQGLIMMIVCDSGLTAVEKGGDANGPIDGHFCVEGKVLILKD